MNKKVEDWIDSHEDDLIEDIKNLCAIPSVQGEPEEGKPFGDGPYRALNMAASLAGKYGFSVKNYDNYAAAADIDPSLPRTLDMLCHTDVVPAGEGWTVTEPYKVKKKDGRIYGRGTSDDKGPLMAAMYAMRAVKECGVSLKKGVRLIMGANEETGSADIAYYYKKEPEAPMTFSPDGNFPVINIEKGQFRGELIKHTEEDTSVPRLLSLDAGVAFNAVPQKAVMHFEGLDTGSERTAVAIKDVQEKCGVSIDITGSQEITVTGRSAHASMPQEGKNAGLAALMLISKLPLHDSDMLDALRKIPELFPYGVTDGSGINIKMSDKESHDLTCTLDLFKVTPTYAEFTFDARTPLIATKKNCEDAAAEAVRAAGFEWSTPGMIPPHSVPSESPFVKALLRSYEDVTGRKGKCLAIGGGTYVHDIKNGVAFGAVFDDVDTRMHGADEFFDIDNLMTAVKVYADAIERLCG